MNDIYINKKDLKSFCDKLKERYTVYGVRQKEEGFYVFDEIDEFSDPLKEYKPTILPPKKYLFPQQETLLRFDTQPHPDVKPVIESKKQVLFGVRPCDIHGISLLDKIFTTDHEDKNYTQKRADTIIIGIDCLEPCYEHAYCAIVGCLDVDDGYDIMMTDIGDSLYTSVKTEMGEEIVTNFAEYTVAGEEERQRFRELRSEREGKFEKMINTDISNLPLLFQNADNDPVWDELNDKCLGCGRCNIVCPTCYCFDVYDCMELSMTSGERCREWDACTLKDFAVVSSGENFRSTRGHRLRHRFNRKFNYLMTKHNTSFCVGCGRCSKTCPVNIDLVETVNAVIKNNKNHETE
ncbi:hydrogenase [Candidatus Scalindua japonica]|uniref:Hydrogenase n=1 Tax=Candidatus Scalindua japonica TaxID=1284222 RepID=A0A286TVA8_9BACT|nr:4Fe-4S dicluster domain-containing protein [Candidatus Scalindua japonica]GAX59837.1 hydrogenase [Candidatus Scalindua japonica]